MEGEGGGCVWRGREGEGEGEGVCGGEGGHGRGGWRGREGMEREGGGRACREEEEEACKWRGRVGEHVIRMSCALAYLLVVTKWLELGAVD